MEVSTAVTTMADLVAVDRQVVLLEEIRPDMVVDPRAALQQEAAQRQAVTQQGTVAVTAAMEAMVAVAVSASAQALALLHLLVMVAANLIWVSVPILAMALRRQDQI